LFGAGDEVRTRDLDLGKVALYQLSYSRLRFVRRGGEWWYKGRQKGQTSKWWDLLFSLLTPCCFIFNAKKFLPSLNLGCQKVFSGA
jgi:hypothetical protein